MHTIQYTYDGLSRLIAADYFSGENVDGTAFRAYDFAYDLAGNRTQQTVEVAGSPTTTNYTYDAANRLTAVDAQSITYNNAGQMTDDGTLTYSWDRGGRLLSAGSSSYEYNGLGQRLSQTVSAVVTDYLLDLQPGLSKVLAATTSGNTTRYVHDSRGLHSQQQSNGDWVFPITDGLNSVRSVVDESFDVLHSQHYAPYGEPFGESGTSQTDFGFTGEPTDGNGLVHLRARYLNPSLGVFPSLDPVEGALQQAMSLNRYGYVAGNVANLVDPSGLFGETPRPWDTCWQTGGSGRDCSGCPDELMSDCIHGITECPPPPLQSQPCSQPSDTTGTFHYDGDRAARAATYLARVGRINAVEWAYEGLNPDLFYVSPTNSARFISLALSEGGLPMTQGWYASCRYGKVHPITYSWNGHKQLITYLTDEGIVDISESVEVSTLTLFGSDFSTGPVPEYDQTSRVIDVTALQVLAAQLQNFRAGDYVYGTTVGSGYNEPVHGFLVAGQGPALPCNNSQLDFVESSTSISSLDDTDALGGLTVPYIVDLYGVQRGTPRPFYCGFLSDNEFGNARYFVDEAHPTDIENGIYPAMNHMRFYKMPGDVTVDCGRYIARDFNIREGCLS